MNPTCFVIQPFDGGRYDKRYKDIYEPAIVAAGLVPYRVDQDPRSEIPIEQIEDGIRNAAICFAEITVDNPNVWFELGYAISAQKPVVMVCAKDRERFPFDVQHRSIVRYSTDSASDFEELRTELIAKLKGTMDRQKEIGSLSGIKTVVQATSGLNGAEVVALVLIATHEKLNRHAMSGYQVNRDMTNAGYTDAACAMALRSLERRHFIRARIVEDYNEEYLGYLPEEGGWSWLDENEGQIQQKRPPVPALPLTFDADDLPF